MKFAEAQFILAILMSPHFALATLPKDVTPKTNNAESKILFNFIISPN
jgi:hypothetical protein